MGALAQVVLLRGPWALLGGLALLGVGVFMASSGLYRGWYNRLVQSLNPRAVEKSPHRYLAGALTICLFGVLAVVSALIELFSGVK